MKNNPPNLQELRNLLIQIEDSTGKLDFQTSENFWKKSQYINPFIALGQKFNELTLAGKIHGNHKKAFWDLCQDNGYYPIRLPKKRMIFIHWHQLQDVKDELQIIYENELKIKQQQQNANTTN